MKVIGSPTLGVGSLTVLVTARSACWGVSVALAVLLPVFGSNWSASLMVAVLVCATGLTTVAAIASSVCGARWRPCPRPRCRWRCRSSPGWASPTRTSGPAGSRSVTCTPVAASRAAVGQRDGEGDRVADVGRRVADRLGQRQVGLLRRQSAVSVLLAVFGSNWSACAMRRRVGPAGRADHGRRDRQRRGRRGVTVPTVQTPVPRRRCPGCGVGRHEGQARRQQVGHLTPVAASGPVLVSVTVKMIVSPTLGVGLLTVLVTARSACCGVSVALALLLPVFGSNWSASLIVAVLVCAVGADHRGDDGQRLRRAGG